jgi:BirA family biotin operon repressor/biotin-[acetyl-CoA-carboxylase] ligase
LFELEKFDLKLNTDVIGRNFIYAEEVTSTNTELLNRNKFYKHHGSVLLAENQIEGRGRKNREWLSDKEMNLTFSVLLTDSNYLTEKINVINFAASLAVALSIENLYQLRTALKWPNDVLIGGKKVAGILMESISQGSKVTRLVIGIGLNVNQISFQGKYLVNPTSLRKELGHHIEREKTLADVLNNLEELLESSLRPFNKIIEEWKSKCMMIGEKITVSIDDRMKQGIFNDIDENGFLVLRTDNKVETLHIGDVSIL